MVIRVKLSSLALVAALAVVGCESSTVCTLIGCLDGLTVEIQNAPAGPITVQATVEGASGSVHTVTCPGTSGCTNKFFFSEFTPSQTRLTITTTAGTREQVVTPTYETFQPNGPKCGPTCRGGTARVVWQ
jgi:hypothetical protein